MNLCRGVVGQGEGCPTQPLRTSPALLAATTTRRCLTGDRVLHLALTLVRTIVSEHAHLALLVATLARPAWGTGAAAIDGIAGGIV